jgi:hypothetical protein
MGGGARVQAGKSKLMNPSVRIKLVDRIPISIAKVQLSLNKPKFYLALSIKLELKLQAPSVAINSNG